MNKVALVLTQVAHLIGIYPHDGKQIIFVKENNHRQKELMQGEVFGSTIFLFDHTNLDQLSELHRLGLLVEAANALRVPPSFIETRLNRGEKILYRHRLSSEQK